jgi:hypothetical protein
MRPNTKLVKRISSALLASTAIFSVSAVDAEAIETDKYSVGIWVGAKAASNIQVLPRGRQAEPAFNFLPDVGLRGYLPVSDEHNIHVVPEVYFSNYFYTTKDANTGLAYRTELSSVIGGLSLFIEGFEMGFGYGTVVSAGTDAGDELSSEIFQDIVNFTFGYRYSFYSDENGTLSAFARTEILLTEVFQNYPDTDPYTEFILPDFQVELQEQHNPRLAALTIGLAWDFNVASFMVESPEPRSRANR